MTTDLAKVLGGTFRERDKLVGAVERHLLVRDQISEYHLRGLNSVHPSEAAHSHWCHRSTYYRLSGAPAEVMPTPLAFEMAFETGHDAHHKWQTWFREMGVLRGTWLCLVCGHRGWATSPKRCGKCGAEGKLLEYTEVPLENTEYMLKGSADGDVVFPAGSKLIEIKTIGTGTVRIEAPKLLARHSYIHTDDTDKVRTGVDWYALWSSIHRPFPSHLRQGMLYLFCTGRKEIVYIYDPKFLTAKPKEFEVKFNKDLIEDILDRCLVVRRSLEKGYPPKRPAWAEETHTVCKNCPYRNTCYGRNNDGGSDIENRSGKRSRKAQPGKARTRSTAKARVRFTEAPAEDH